jgi:uncharacterized protein YcnI
MVNRAIAITAIALAGLMITLTAIAALSDSQTLPLNGTISTLNVDAYTDSACTVPCTSLSVGSISPGSSATQTIYIKNAGTVPMTLTMAISNWNPTTASNYLTVTWNRQGSVVNAGASVQAVITVTAAASTGTLTTFSCSVTITGAE